MKEIVSSWNRCNDLSLLLGNRVDTLNVVDDTNVVGHDGFTQQASIASHRGRIEQIQQMIECLCKGLVGTLCPCHVGDRLLKMKLHGIRVTHGDDCSEKTG